MASTQTIDKSELKLLRDAVEEAFGEKISGPSSFNRLRIFLLRRTGNLLGQTTLKRIWGYVDTESNLRTSTLSVLAKAIGYSDMDEFVESHKSTSHSETRLSSSPKFNKYVDVNRDLKPGQTLKIFWYPARECVIRYLGGMRFEVVSAKNTRLRARDTFICHILIAGYPLYLSSLTRAGSEPTAYICGKLHGGIQIEIAEHDAESAASD